MYKYYVYIYKNIYIAHYQHYLHHDYETYIPSSGGYCHGYPYPHRAPSEHGQTRPEMAKWDPVMCRVYRFYMIDSTWTPTVDTKTENETQKKHANYLTVSIHALSLSWGQSMSKYVKVRMISTESQASSDPMSVPNPISPMVSKVKPREILAKGHL